MRLFAVLLASLIISGCANRTYEELNIDSTSNITVPSKGKAGVYVYQWKTGLLGAGFDVGFEIKGNPEVFLNTGEYAYLEVNPGDHHYKLIGGPFPQFLPITLKEGQNYFFRAVLNGGTDRGFLILDQSEIDAAKRNITSGRYELNTVD